MKHSRKQSNLHVVTKEAIAWLFGGSEYCYGFHLEQI
jgi:hypothetical protein